MKLKIKELNRNGFSHTEVLLVGLVLVVVAGVGFFVYKHNSNPSVVHASTWQSIQGSGNFRVTKAAWTISTFAACVTPVYYGVYNVGVLAGLTTPVSANYSGLVGSASVTYVTSKVVGDGYNHQTIYTNHTTSLGSSHNWWLGKAQSFQHTVNIPPSSFSSAYLNYHISSTLGAGSSKVYLSAVKSRC
jgi:uncharacterized protein (UPF0333 family)